MTVDGCQLFVTDYHELIADNRQPSTVNRQLSTVSHQLSTVNCQPITLVMSDKLIDKERLKALWGDIRMLDILEIAREEGLREGKDLGLREGKDLGLKKGLRKGTQEMIIEALIQRFDLIPSHVSEQI
ncbi:Yae1 family protein, partial [Desulfobacterales bacterium HSG2]|nr:Yae1 family protein [Desulfobacterales bacterium HSG2]